MNKSRLMLAACGVAMSVGVGNAQEYGVLLEFSVGNQKFSNVLNSNDDGVYQNFSDTVYVGSLSAGLSFGSFGLQLDRVVDSSGDPGDDKGGFSARSTTLHANYRTGAYAVGLFYGVGDNSPPVDSDLGDVTFRGVEAAASFDTYRIAGQIGSASHTNEHSSLDYSNEMYGIVEAQVYLDNGLTLSGSLGYGTGIIHDDDIGVTQVAFGVSKALGSSGLVGTAGLRHTMTTDHESGSNEGKGNNTELLIGLTLPLGGSSVREINENSVSMMRTNLPAIVAAMTAVYD